MDEPLLVAVMGPTASGKTALAERIAERLEAQLVNADAFQIYRYLDIGTSKPRDRAKYALIDIRNPNEPFGLGEWVSLAMVVLNEAWDRSRNVVVVGGTGLYIRALFEQYSEMGPQPDPALRSALLDREKLEGLPSLFAELQAVDPAAAEQIDPRNPARVRRALERALSPAAPMRVTLPPFRTIKLAVDPPKQVLDVQIERRTATMIQNGWIQEVRCLREMGFAEDAPALRAIGYLDVLRHTQGVISLQGAIARIVAATRRYAKRQRTWLRGEPRLHRLSGEAETEALFAEAMERIA
jgi:tRNA dimethylallyltransferase